jgi:hypothetical protein
MHSHQVSNPGAVAEVIASGVCYVCCASIHMQQQAESGKLLLLRQQVLLLAWCKRW